MRNWEDIKKLDKEEFNIFRNDYLIKDKKINRYHDYWIDIYYDKENDEYYFSIFWDIVNRKFKNYDSCYRLIHRLAVELLYLNRHNVFTTDYLKSMDLV